ncbi:MAG: hypothetical protein WBD57_09535 [Candidatus Cybelea sp.]
MKQLAFIIASILVAASSVGCSSTQSQGGFQPAVPTGTAVLSMAHPVQMPIRPDRLASSMAVGASKRGGLLYADDWATNAVYVFDYPSGKQVGVLTGLDAPYGMCVDAQGDIYIGNFYGNTLVEYAHGGDMPLKTYSVVGQPMGCSVDAKGDVSVTSFNPGEVMVFAGGDPTKGTTYAGPCEFQWTMGYDDKRNLVGVGEESTGAIVACALLAGSKSIIVLSGCCTGPMQIDFAGGTMWDGKYLAVGNQEVGGSFESGVYQAKVSGTTLKVYGQTDLTDNCFSNYTDVVNPFVVGGKNTPANRRQGKVILGSNLWCNDAGGGGGINLWHYPAGGPVFRQIGASLGEPYGAAVSFAK